MMMEPDALVIDCEVEFADLPGHRFLVSSDHLGLRLLDLNPRVQSSTDVRLVKVTGNKHFPRALITAFRVHNNAFAIDERLGLFRLIDQGIQVLMSGYQNSTELRQILAAVAVGTRLGLSSENARAVIARARSVVRDCAEDILLVKETFLELGFINSSPPSDQGQCSSPPISLVEKGCCNWKNEERRLAIKIQDLQTQIENLKTENKQLLTALDQAYIGVNRNDRKRLEGTHRTRGSVVEQ